jgi:hypothetical protein
MRRMTMVCKRLQQEVEKRLTDYTNHGDRFDAISSQHQTQHNLYTARYNHNLMHYQLRDRPAQVPLDTPEDANLGCSPLGYLARCWVRVDNIDNDRNPDELGRAQVYSALERRGYMHPYVDGWDLGFNTPEISFQEALRLAHAWFYANKSYWDHRFVAPGYRQRVMVSCFLVGVYDGASSYEVLVKEGLMDPPDDSNEWEWDE